MSYNITPVPIQEDIADPDRKSSFVWQEWFRQVRDRIMNTTTDHTATSIPTTGTWKFRDLVINSNPSELGTAGNKYILYGWYCITAGTPGTWKELRFLTGN